MIRGTINGSKILEHTLERYKSVVFTNGIFDILHVGHVKLLEFARSLGDELIVAINSDESTKFLKGSNRPINTEMDRKYILQALSSVDDVIVFDETIAGTAIRRVNPNIVVKSSDYSEEDVRRIDRVPNEVMIKIFPLEEGYSTTEMIRRMNENIDHWA